MNITKSGPASWPQLPPFRLLLCVLKFFIDKLFFDPLTHHHDPWLNHHSHGTRLLLNQNFAAFSCSFKASLCFASDGVKLFGAQMKTVRMREARAVMEWQGLVEDHLDFLQPNLTILEHGADLTTVMLWPTKWPSGWSFLKNQTCKKLNSYWTVQGTKRFLALSDICAQKAVSLGIHPFWLMAIKLWMSSLQRENGDENKKKGGVKAPKRSNRLAISAFKFSKGTQRSWCHMAWHWGSRSPLCGDEGFHR